MAVKRKFSTAVQQAREEQERVEREGRCVSSRKRLGNFAAWRHHAPKQLRMGPVELKHNR